MLCPAIHHPLAGQAIGVFQVVKDGDQSDRNRRVCWSLNLDIRNWQLRVNILPISGDFFSTKCLFQGRLASVKVGSETSSAPTGRLSNFPCVAWGAVLLRFGAGKVADISPDQPQPCEKIQSIGYAPLWNRKGQKFSKRVSRNTEPRDKKRR